jgi:hypothetical protein
MRNTTMSKNFVDTPLAGVAPYPWVRLPRTSPSADSS